MYYVKHTQNTHKLIKNNLTCNNKQQNLEQSLFLDKV